MSIEKISKSHKNSDLFFDRMCMKKDLSVRTDLSFKE